MKRMKSQVQDFMTADPIVISPGTSLVEAYNVMFDHEIRRLPVVEGDELIGIITLSDILQATPGRLDDLDIETRLEISARTVRDAMSYDPITITPEDTIQEAAEHMLEYQISGLPVVQDGHVAGIITESDIFKLFVDAWSEEQTSRTRVTTVISDQLSVISR
jgi:acetoin utilization protein AcuB